jgi:PAS domain S-box-containing protein
MFDLKFNVQTDVLTVSSTMSVVEVVGQMEQQRVSYALVVDDHNQLAGIFTKCDGTRAIARSISPTDLPIAAVMTQPVVSIQAAEAQDAQLVFERLRQHSIRHLPVVDEHGKATGIIILSNAALYETVADLKQTVTLQTQALEQEITHRQALADTLNTIGGRYLTMETKLDDILNRAIASIICFRMDADRHYCYEYFSAGCEQVFGYSPTEFMADSSLWIRRVFPQDVEAVIQPSWEKIFAGEDHQKEYRFFHKDGSLRWILSNVTSRYDAASETWVVTTTDTDITSQKQIEAALRSSEMRFRAMFEQSGIGIAQTTFSGAFLKVNQRFCGIVGYSADELVQMRLRDVLHPEDVEEVKYKRQQLVDGEIQCFSTEKRYVRKDGAIAWGRITASLVREESGWPHYFIGMIEDIQQQKLVENTLRQKEEQLRLSLDLTHIGMWDWHIQSDELLWNENSARLLGLPTTVLKVNAQIWNDSLHPDDRDRVWAIASTALTNHTNFEAEYRVVWPDSTIRWILSKGHALYGEIGEATRMVGCIIDITDRKQAEAALAESETKFRQLANHTREIFWMTNADGSEVLYISPAFETVWGISIDYLYQHPKAWMETIVPSDRPRVAALWATLPRASYEMEYQIEHQDGSHRWVWDRGNAIYDDQGKICRMGGLIEDITIRKQTEAILRNNETRFRAIFEQVAVGIAEISLTGDYLRVNQGYCKILGYSESELLKLNFEDVTYADDVELSFSCVRQVMVNNCQQCTFEKRYVRKDGQVRWTSASVTLVRNESGTPNHILCVLQDIHDRKLAEQALQESETRFREIANTIRQFFFTRSAVTGKFLYVSPAYEQLWGRSCESLYDDPTSWLESIHPSDRHLVQVSLQQQAQQSTTKREYRIIRPSGEVRWITAEISVIADEFGQPSRYVGFAEDITDRKLAEQALRDSEERFREITETIEDVFFIEPPDASQSLYVSPAIEKVFGYTVEAIYQNSMLWGKGVHPDDRDLVLASLEQQRQGYPTQKEYRIIREDGSLRWIFARTFPIVDATGQVLRHIGLSEDITARKHTEKALRDSEERFREIAETIQDVFFINSPDISQVLYCSPAYASIWGRPVEELYTNSRAWLEAVHPEDQDWVWNVFIQQIEGKPYQAEYRIIRPDGTQRWVLDRTFPIFDKAGQLQRHVGVVTDITDRKHVEAALRDSEERFRQITESINEVFFIESADIQSTLYISPAFERDWGLTPANLHGNSGPAQVQVHPNDRALVDRALEQQRHGQPTEKEYRIIYPNGFIRWIFARTFPIYNEAGVLLRHVGIAEDMTVRKTIEETLRAQTELLQTILDHVPTMINLIDQQGQLLWVNQEWENVLGWTLEDGMTRNLFEEFYPDPICRQQVYECIQSARREWVELKTHTHYGTVIDTAWANVQLSDGRVIGIGQDISDRKHAEAQIRASLKEKESLLQEIHHRVKNNLQVISSLLKLQANRIDDPKAREALEDSWSRVDSMALVHESLYRSDNFSIVDFETYIRNLIKNLFHIYDVAAQNISLQVDVSATATLNLDQAVPCGLIVNELISNALKHGLKGQKTGQIKVIFSKNSQGNLVLSVANSGNHLPPNFDLATSQTMGLRLVLSLVNQLEGVLEVEQNDYTTFRILFNSVEPSNGL